MAGGSEATKAAGTTAITSATKILGGIIVMKKFAVGAVMIVAMLIGLWVVRDEESGEDSSTSGVVQTEEAVADVGDAPGLPGTGKERVLEVASSTATLTQETAPPSEKLSALSPRMVESARDAITVNNQSNLPEQG
ncbi:hypothetical protein ACFL1X_09100 [Candidatus Hydrogenedentota bacterium]